MIPITLLQLSHIVHGKLQCTTLQATQCVLQQVVTDSRLPIAPSTLFIALYGPQYNGHIFAEQAVAKGVQALLVQYILPLPVPQVVVADTHLALGLLAAWVRQQFSPWVVALTGSSGKTTVKEMTAAILSRYGPVLYTTENENNTIGVPKTLLRLVSHHRYAVIELGANQPGEIAYTSSLVRPAAVLITNLTAAHLAGFGSLVGVAKAKGEIFNHLADQGRAIIHRESHALQHWQRQLAGKALWQFSLCDNTADFYVSHLQQLTNGTHFYLHTPLGVSRIRLALLGRHNVANAAAAAALAMAVGASLEESVAALEEVHPIPGRLFPIHLNKDHYLLDDTYNANLGSMLAAVHTLSQMPGYRILVVGDMAELGNNTSVYHRQVAEAVQGAAIDRVLSIGTESAVISQLNQGVHFTQKISLMETLWSLLNCNRPTTLLVKGSRNMCMEQVVTALQSVQRGLC